MMRILTFVLLLALTSGIVSAQSGPPEPDDGQVRAAILRAFENRLRQALALSDEQFDTISPHVRAMERERTRMRRERFSLLREMKSGLERGGTDAELQSVLDRFHELEAEEQRAERASLAQIDASLSVRQRVQLRFFVDRFRNELRDRVDDIRDRRPRPRPRRR